MRRYKHYMIALLVVALFIWYILWSAIQYRLSVPLVRDYHYYHMDAGVVIFLADNSRIQKVLERAEQSQIDVRIPETGPNVDGYRVYSRIIAGHVSKAKDRNAFGDKILTDAQRPIGYFVIDVRNDIIYDGLNKKEWLNKLRSFGIKREPRLYKPSVFDKFLGRNKPSPE